MRIVFTVEEVCKVSFTRYKEYVVPENVVYPTEWNDWSVDEKYTWVNNNCHFYRDYAEETDSEIEEEVATEMEVSE
jgi:starvation-inducible outer membrane lipoprotein